MEFSMNKHPASGPYQSDYSVKLKRAKKDDVRVV